MIPQIKDVHTFNQLLAVLNIDDETRIISVEENGIVDSNFIITHLMKQMTQKKNKFCLLLLHNNLEHYQIVAKKLGFNLDKSIEENSIELIDIQANVVEHVNDEVFLKTCMKNLYVDLEKAVENLYSSESPLIYIVIDDISHLLDMGFDSKHIFNFLSYCTNLVSDKIRLIVTCHVCCRQDKLLSNYLRYVCDVYIEVSPLSTGKSVDVSGIITIKRSNNFMFKKNQYHFKSFDRGIKVFSPGQSIYNLYK